MAGKMLVQSTVQSISFPLMPRDPVNWAVNKQIMNRFEFLANKWNVDIRQAKLSNDVALTRFYDYAVISYDCDLSKTETIVGVAMMFAVLELGWEGRRFYFRFPLPQEPTGKESIRKAKKDYRKAFRWASDRLIPDQAIEEICREEREPGELCEDLCVTPELVEIRLRNWVAMHQDLIWFPRLA